jgi:hypothetical protein
MLLPKGEEPFQAFGDHTIEHRVLGFARSVADRSARHADASGRAQSKQQFNDCLKLAAASLRISAKTRKSTGKLGRVLREFERGDNRRKESGFSASHTSGSSLVTVLQPAVLGLESSVSTSPGFNSAASITHFTTPPDMPCAEEKVFVLNVFLDLAETYCNASIGFNSTIEILLRHSRDLS